MNLRGYAIRSAMRSNLVFYFLQSKISHTNRTMAISEMTHLQLPLG